MAYCSTSFDFRLPAALLITVQLAWRESLMQGQLRSGSGVELLLAAPSASLSWTPCFQLFSLLRSHESKVKPPHTVTYNLAVQDAFSSTHQVGTFHVFSYYEIVWICKEDVNLINQRAATTVSQSERIGRFVPSFLVAFPTFVFSQVFSPL